MAKICLVLSIVFYSHIVLALSEPVRHVLKLPQKELVIWEKSPPSPKAVILLLHGRTYSSRTVFDFQFENGKYSLMDALVSHGYAVFALDQPGYGESPRHESGWFTPAMGVENIASSLRYIQNKHPSLGKTIVFGWSMGSTLALLVAQKYPQLMSEFIVFGFWRDLDIPIENDPIIAKVAPPSTKPQRIPNTSKQAASDFVAPNGISKKGVDEYVRIALKNDPVRVDLKDLNEFSAIDPSKIKVPMLLIQGAYDDYSSTSINAKLFTRLASMDKRWVILPNGDHAAHMQNTRDEFVSCMISFIERPGRK